MTLVTGGAGFIGSNSVLAWLSSHDGPGVNPDRLTYAGNLEDLASISGDSRPVFGVGDICDALARKPLAVYGDAGSVRDWIQVKDHRSALRAGLERVAPTESVESGLRKPVAWYLEHSDRIATVPAGSCRSWIARQYGGEAAR